MHSVWGAARGKARKRRPKRTLGRLLFIYGLGSRVHTRTPEAGLVEGGVVTGGKPTTPRDTREQGDTSTQYNRQTTALRPNQPVAVGRRRGMSCNAMWCGIARL